MRRGYTIAAAGASYSDRSRGGDRPAVRDPGPPAECWFLHWLRCQRAGYYGLSGTAQSDILRMFWGRRIERASGGSSTMTVDRRRILQIALGGGSLSPLVLPERWVKPVVKSVIVPAHAAASPATTTTTTTTPAPTTSPS